MNDYKKLYIFGYLDGLKDSSTKIKKTFDKKKVLSMLYDLGYIKGYKNKTLK